MHAAIQCQLVALHDQLFLQQQVLPVQQESPQLPERVRKKKVMKVQVQVWVPNFGSQEVTQMSPPCQRKAPPNSQLLSSLTARG